MKDSSRKGNVISAWAEGARKSIPQAPKVSEPSLRHLASYARIAIHIGEFYRLCPATGA
jgi:hypothetical protein